MYETVVKFIACCTLCGFVNMHEYSIACAELKAYHSITLHVSILNILETIERFSSSFYTLAFTHGESFVLTRKKKLLEDHPARRFYC